MIDRPFVSLRRAVLKALPIPYWDKLMSNSISASIEETVVITKFLTYRLEILNKC